MADAFCIIEKLERLDGVVQKLRARKKQAGNQKHESKK